MDLREFLILSVPWVLILIFWIFIFRTLRSQQRLTADVTDEGLLLPGTETVPWYSVRNATERRNDFVVELNSGRKVLVPKGESMSVQRVRGKLRSVLGSKANLKRRAD